MANIEHEALAYGEGHVIHFAEYATSTLREAATGLTSGDDHKVALQADDHTLWVLTDYSGPTWVPLMGTPGDDTVTGAKIVDDAIDSEHYTDGSIDAAHLASNAVETAKIKDANVTAAKIGADAVDDTKIGDAKIKKEHINADVVGTGLAGGAGTALSVDGIVEVGASAELKVKVIEIGDWNMDTTSGVNVAHGLTMSKIRSTDVMVRRDTDDAPFPLDYDNGGDGQAGAWCVNATNVACSRMAAKFFDSGAFDQTSYNRGWITIFYVA